MYTTHTHTYLYAYIYTRTYVWEDNANIGTDNEYKMGSK